MSEERALEWDGTIQNDSDFEVIPAGEYEFAVLNFKRERHDPRSPGKIPAGTPKAVLELQIEKAGEVIGKTSENLFLHTRCEGLLSGFFRSIGLKKHGEPLVMDWSKVPGARGRCKVTVRKYKKTDGTETEQNDVRFLDPVEENADFPPADDTPKVQPIQAGGWV